VCVEHSTGPASPQRSCESKSMVKPLSQVGKKAPRGRQQRYATKITLRFLPEALTAIDYWRVSQPDQPVRAEAIRRLVELGLKSQQK